METGPREWPSEQWQLTAPESYVLRLPRPRRHVELFKLALRELVLRRALTIEQLEQAGLFRQRSKTVLRVGTQHMSEPALAPLVELHSRARRRSASDGVLVEDFAKEARREFTGSLMGYLNNHVYPSLVQRGLMEVEEPTGLRAFRRRRHVRTAAGGEALAELEEWLRVGNACLKDWVRDSPERALAYTAGAGAAVLLMPGLYPELERIGRQVPGGDAAIGHGWAADFEGFDGIDAGFGAGGWGGGDSGGGGNGGGGSGSG